MRPILFHLFGLPVYAYGFSLALAFAVGTWLASRDAVRRGIAADHLINVAMISAISGVVGSRILFVLLDFRHYLESPLEIFNISAGGLSMHGGFVLAIWLGVWYCKRYNVSPWMMADVTAPYAALGIGIVRIGCFLNGCCYGTQAPAPWGIDCSYWHDYPRYPTQLYESGLDLLLFGYLFLNRRHRHFDGWLMFAMVGWYSVIRFVVEIFREVPRVVGPLSPAQIASLGFAAGAFAVSATLERRRGKYGIKG